MEKAVKYLRQDSFKDIQPSQEPYIDMESGVYDGNTSVLKTALEIAYLEGIIDGQADMTGEVETKYGDLNDVFNKLYDLTE